MKTQAVACLLLIAAFSLAAPIPKSLKIKSIDTGYEGYWEQTGSNSNLKEGGITHGKYWKIESDKFYYNLKETVVLQGSNKGPLSTLDDTIPCIRMYNTTRCRLEIQDDVLTWVFGNDKTDSLENCDPGPNRVIYYFKRVK